MSDVLYDSLSAEDLFSNYVSQSRFLISLNEIQMCRILQIGREGRIMGEFPSRTDRALLDKGLIKRKKVGNHKKLFIELSLAGKSVRELIMLTGFRIEGENNSPEERARLREALLPQDAA